MVLSIGMIVKNEEKYLEECLTALQPILDELDSELIIADTGSTDRTVEIAKKFTDNVFYFEWINDFAAARNSTLEKAQGEWFMFIDADEIAADCSALIKFFKSGEYKSYNSAGYVQRSFLEEENEKNYVDFKVLRVVRREQDTKFVSPIHEYLTPFKKPVKYLDFVVLHYGYQYVNSEGQTELAREKSKRNLDLLQKELEAHKDGDVRINIYNQIADCYEIIDDYDNALKYIDMGLEKADHSSVNVFPFYTHKVYILAGLERFDELIETVTEYFDIKKNPFHTKELAADCYIRAMRGYAYYKRQKYTDAIHDLARFIDLYGKYTKGKFDNSDEFAMDTWRLTETVVMANYDIFFRCCYQERQFAVANEYVNAIPLEAYFGNESFMTNHLNIRVEMMEELGYNNLDKLYRQLDEFGKTFLLTAVRRKIFSTKPENRSMIIKKLTALGNMPAELAEIYKGHFDNAPSVELIETFLQKHGSENSEDMLYIMLENQMDITPFLLTEDLIADRAAQFIIYYFSSGVGSFQNYDIDNISQDGLLKATNLYGYVMLRAMQNGSNVSELFEKYGALGMKWDKAFGGLGSIPGDIRAALLVHNVVSQKKSGDKTRFMNAIRELKGVVPDLVPLAEAYKNENKDSLKAARVNPEFEKLAVQVKSNIRELIASGNIGDARKLLKEYEGIAPNDPDIELLKDEINNSLQ